MSDNRFRDAVGQIDDRLLERCEAYEQRLSEKKRKNLFGCAAVAACLVLLAGVFLYALPEDPPYDMNLPSVIPTNGSTTPTMPPSISGDVTQPPSTPGDVTQPPSIPGDVTQPPSTPGDVTQPPSIPDGPIIPPSLPTVEEMVFSAEDIAALFPGKGSIAEDGTVEYQKVYVSNAERLILGTLPTATPQFIYRYMQYENAVNKATAAQFANSIFPALAEALGGTVPEYTVNAYANRVDIDTAIGNHGVLVSQYGYMNYLCISRLPWRSAEPTTTTLHGQTVQADQSKSDEEIIAGLSEVHRILQDIFDVDFPDAKVVRTYDAASDYGALALQVYFYNEDAHPLNACSETPVSDCIELWFYNNPIFMKEECSETVLQYVDISYRSLRTDVAYLYPPIGTSELLSLEEAEMLLEKGYTFGGHRCMICVTYQDAVDFTEYDFVSYTYQWSFDRNTGKRNLGIPFYVFFKRIGTAENGNEIYAITYVPAIAVSDLEEYFKNQEKLHK